MRILMLCSKCGSKVKPTKKCKGRLSTEICLWILPILLIVVNGLALVENPNDFLTVYGFAGSLYWAGPIWFVALCYTLYRFLSPRKRICPVCKNEGGFIPVDSPFGKKLLIEQSEPMQSHAKDPVKEDISVVVES